MNTEEVTFDKVNASANFSLLYPSALRSDQQNLCLELSAAAQHDLGVDQIVAAFTANREYQKEIHRLFSRLPCDPDVISYRQDVLDDLLANPELVERLMSLLPVIDSLFKYSYRLKQEMNSLHEVIWRQGNCRIFSTASRELERYFSW